MHFGGHHSTQSRQRREFAFLMVDEVNFKYKITNGFDLEFIKKEAQGLLFSI